MGFTLLFSMRVNVIDASLPSWALSLILMEGIALRKRFFEQRNPERQMQDTRKPSLDFNFQYENGQDPNYSDAHRRSNGNYFNYNTGNMGQGMGMSHRGSMDFRKDSNF